MKDPKFQGIIYDEDGEALVRQQLIDMYHEGTSDQITPIDGLNDQTD
ncbi:hypothetical protein [Desertibacillus haloalkaliphilus]|nr:hypothetical protein [Desertibacillus haloalkaliphilus]MBU8905177.1 hypothetical protein [Desertibacillus haloalkaliphilus]